MVIIRCPVNGALDWAIDYFAIVDFQRSLVPCHGTMLGDLKDSTNELVQLFGMQKSYDVHKISTFTCYIEAVEAQHFCCVFVPTKTFNVAGHFR